MNVNKYAKAIVAAVAAGYTAFAAAGGSTGHQLVIGLVAAIVTGVITWGVPNDVATELQAIEGYVHDLPTQPFPVVPAAGVKQ